MKPTSPTLRFCFCCIILPKIVWAEEATTSTPIEELEQTYQELRNRQELVDTLDSLDARIRELEATRKDSQNAFDEASSQLSKAEAIKRRELSIIERTRAEGEHLGDLLTVSGKKYEEAIITKVSDVGISIRHKSGLSRVPAAELPTEMHDRFIFEEEAAAIIRANEQQQAQLMNQLANQAQEDQEARNSAPNLDREKDYTLNSTTTPTRNQPAGRLKLFAKTVSTRTQRNSWEQAWGAVDESGAVIVANAGREKVTRRVVGVTLTCPSDSSGGDYVVEMYWFGFPLDKKSKRYVCSAAVKPVTMERGTKVTIAIASDYNYTDEAFLYLESDPSFNEWQGLYVRGWSGYTYAGWAVRISDGNGKIIAQQGAQPSFLRHLKSIPLPRKK